MFLDFKKEKSIYLKTIHLCWLSRQNDISHTLLHCSYATLSRRPPYFINNIFTLKILQTIKWQENKQFKRKKNLKCKENLLVFYIYVYNKHKVMSFKNGKDKNLKTFIIEKFFILFQ